MLVLGSNPCLSISYFIIDSFFCGNNGTTIISIYRASAAADNLVSEREINTLRPTVATVVTGVDIRVFILL